MKTVPTYTATIYVGEPEPGAAAKICRAYCDEIGLCVTVTPTLYVYRGGQEPGVAVGLINYPRFPSTPEEIRRKALRLAELLKEGMQQRGASIVFPDETVWLPYPEAA